MNYYRIEGAVDPLGKPITINIENGYFTDAPHVKARIIEADGLIALPGLVDLHTHLREPGFENSETISTGTKAAARGGYSAVFAMANLNPVTHGPEQVKDIYARAARESFADVFVIGSLTHDLAGKKLSLIEQMAQCGVNVFSDDGRCLMDAHLMRQALLIAAQHDLLIAQHSQDHNLATETACADERSIAAKVNLPAWPASAESVIIARDVQLAYDTGSRLHCCHITTAESVEIIRWAKKKGIRVTAEVTPHHLLLGSELLTTKNTTFKVNPPLRGSEDIDALRDGLQDGTIDIVGTDHAPHCDSAKNTDFPHAKPGMTGLEQSLAAVMETMVNTGRMSWTDIVRTMSATPARLGKAKGHSGSLMAGSLAHLTLVDPQRRSIVDPQLSASKSRNNPYAGLDLPDPIMATFCRGRLTYRDTDLAMS